MLVSVSLLLVGCASGRFTPETPIPHSGQFLKDYAETSRFRLGNPGSFQPMPDGSGVLFLRAAGSRTFRQDLWLYDVSAGSERVLLTADQLLGGAEERLSPEELARRERARSSSRGIASYEVSRDGRRLLVPLGGRLFVADTASLVAGTPVVRELRSEHGGAIDPRFSPDGSMVASVRGGALWVTRVGDGAERRVSPLPEGGVAYGEAEFVAQEEMDRSQGYWWSPDSGSIAYQQTDTTGVETFTIADPFDPARAAQTWAYPRAGRANASVTLWVGDIHNLFETPAPAGDYRASPLAAGQLAAVEWDRAEYPYLARVVWAKGSPLCVLVQNRTQTEEVLYRVDPRTGVLAEVLRERDPAWINLLPGSPRFLDDGSFLWLTEGGGDRPALERVRMDGTRTRLASDGLMIQGILGVDAPTGRVVLADAEHNPGTSVVAWSIADAVPAGGRLSEPGCLGSDAQVSAAMGEGLGLWVRTVSPKDGPVRWEVMEQDRLVGSISSRSETAPFAPKVEFLSGVGGRAFQAAVVRPRVMVPGRKYPVIDFAYAGPHSNVVNAGGGGYLLHQWFADQGFIVVLIDGRGTPRRGRAWERAIRGNLIDAALEDHCAALEALCAAYPEMDRSRIGVNGWSFGGYFAAMAVMRRPDVYKAGVAGAPVVDWRDYDTHYTERYMGLPAEAERVVDGVPGNERGYDASSVLTYAKGLSVPFLLIHGTADDNVYFLHSMKLCDALVRAGKGFEFMPLPGQTHGVTKPEWVEAVQSRIAAFFRKSLQPQ